MSNYNEHEEWVVNDQTIREFESNSNNDNLPIYEDSYGKAISKKQKKRTRIGNIVRTITTLLVVGIIVYVIIGLTKTPDYTNYYPDVPLVINSYKLDETGSTTSDGKVISAKYSLKIDIACPQKIKLESCRFVFYLQEESTGKEVTKTSKQTQTFDGELQLHYSLTATFSHSTRLSKIIKVEVLTYEGEVLEPPTKERQKRDDTNIVNVLFAIVPIIIAINVITFIVEAVSFAHGVKEIVTEGVKYVQQAHQQKHQKPDRHIHSKLPVCPYCESQNPKDANKCINCGASLKR